MLVSLQKWLLTKELARVLTKIKMRSEEDREISLRGVSCNQEEEKSQSHKLKLEEKSPQCNLIITYYSTTNSL